MSLILEISLCVTQCFRMAVRSAQENNGSLGFALFALSKNHWLLWKVGLLTTKVFDFLFIMVSEIVKS